MLNFKVNELRKRCKPKLALTKVEGVKKGLCKRGTCFWPDKVVKRCSNFKEQPSCIRPLVNNTGWSWTHAAEWLTEWTLLDQKKVKVNQTFDGTMSYLNLTLTGLNCILTKRNACLYLAVERHKAKTKNCSSELSYCLHNNYCYHWNLGEAKPVKRIVFRLYALFRHSYSTSKGQLQKVSLIYCFKTKKQAKFKRAFNLSVAIFFC